MTDDSRTEHETDLGTPGVPLAPMTVADILDTALDLAKANWRAVLLLGLILALPMSIGTFVVNLVFDANAGAITGSPADGFTALLTDAGVGAAIAIGIVSLIMGVVILPLVYGAITRVVAGAYLGREFGAWQALWSMLPLWLALIAASFVAGIALIPGFFLLVVGALIVQALFFVVIPVIAVEEVGPIVALRRSWRLMSARLVHYIAVLLAVLLVGQVLGLLVSSVPDVLSLVFGTNVALSSALQGVSIVLSTLVTTPFLACVSTLVYFDARVRVEGFDIQMTAAR